ncbi:transcriptional regulatory protein [Mycolicibacterium mageritense DSM 44476 = CIP 104973]
MLQPGGGSVASATGARRAVWHNAVMATPAPRRPGRRASPSAAETRARIIRAAREVFNELGYDAATFTVVAVRSDVTRPAVNHHFGGKSTLYRAVVAQTTTAVIEAATQAREQSTVTARLSTFFAAVVGAGSSDRSGAAFLVTAAIESRRHPELVDAEHDPVAACRRFLSWALTEASDTGELSSDTDTATVVEMLLAALLGMALSAGHIAPHQDPGHVADAFERLLSAQSGRSATR